MFQRGPEAINATARDSWRSLKALFACLLLCSASTTGHALPEDRSQPIHISADQAIRDEKKGFTVYKGNVQMSQGSLKISAGKVTVFHEIEEADRIMAEGSPAHLQQRPGPDKGMMHARARVIEYFKTEERVLLRRDASIEQDGSRVAGESIEYFIDKQLIKADSEQPSEAGNGGSTGNNRVQVVIPASNLPQETPDTKPSAPEAESKAEKETEGDSDTKNATDEATQASGQTRQEDPSGPTDSQ